MTRPLMRWLNRWGHAVVLASAAWTGPASAQARAQVAVPFYSAEQALTGLYAHHLPPLSQAFQSQADALVQATQQHCAMLHSQGADHAGTLAARGALHAQWQQSMAAWEALSTPAVGPVLTRRSHRQIDFWPTRHELITKALDKAPQTLADMERVGTLAKGLPAFARASREANLAGWRAQWASLKAQGQLGAAQQQTPPVLYQNELATALDIPLGFSGADGD